MASNAIDVGETITFTFNFSEPTDSLLFTGFVLNNYDGADRLDITSGLTTLFSGGSADDQSIVGGGYEISDGSEITITPTTGAFRVNMLTFDALAAVPEPSTYALFAGVIAVGIAAYRRRRS